MLQIFLAVLQSSLVNKSVAGLVEIKGYDDFIVNLCPDGTAGEVNLLADIYIQFPKQPSSDLILFSNLPKEEQYWKRIEPPTDLTKIRSMDEWSEMPREFREKYSSYIKEEFRRRRHGVWFMNNGVPTYITGRHYMMLQWSKIDIGYPNYLAFQRDLFLHEAACELDPRSLGQLYTKCRRSGYTNMSACILVDEATQVKDKLLGIMSKTGKDAQEKFNNLVKQVGLEEAKKQLGNEQLANQFQQQSVQERFAQATEKLQEIFEHYPLAGPKWQYLNALIHIALSKKETSEGE